MQKKAIAQITEIEENQKRAVMARLKEFGKNAIQIVIDNAANSDFLNGCGDRGWVANFDWLFKKSNFKKVLEGNYANPTTKKKTYNGSGTTQEERMNDAARLIQELRQKAINEGEWYEDENFNTDPIQILKNINN